MAYNGGGGKRLCTGGVDLVSERSNGGGVYGTQTNPKRKRDEPSRPNHILLYTVVNPSYPITVDVIHTISSPHGQVQRIVIFKKNGVQAMVEFESLESATRAKEALNGADIYSGCCTLKIEYAKPEKLNVFKNDHDSWDYTVREDFNPPPQRNTPLLQSPQYTGGRPQPYSGQRGRPPTSLGAQVGGLLSRMRANAGYHIKEEDEDRRRPSMPLMRRQPYFMRDQYDDMDYSGGPPPGPGLMKDSRGHLGPPHHHQGPPFGNAAPPQMHGPPHHAHTLMLAPASTTGHGSVLMVYGLDPRTANADRLFNLVCLYGNVARVKFLKTKEGTAMVQMGDVLAVERCIQHLNNVTVGDNTLSLAFSKQTYLSEVTNPYPLPDKSPSFKDYNGNKNNRFMTPASIHKNRIQAPSKILHFFNTPPDVTEDQLIAVFNDYGVDAPQTISKFPLKSEKSSSGLMEFGNTSQAVQAIMACNHATIQHPGSKFPFVMKLCFSSARAIGSGPQVSNKQSSFNNNNNASMEQDHQTDDDQDCDYE